MFWRFYDSIYRGSMITFTTDYDSVYYGCKSVLPYSIKQKRKLDTSCRKRQLSPHPATPNPAVVPKSDFIKIFGQMIVIVTSKVFLQKLL